MQGVRKLNPPSDQIFNRFNKIIFASYGVLVALAGVLFWIEYQGIYKGYLKQLDLYFTMESNILSSTLGGKDASLDTVSLTSTDFGTAYILDAKGSVVKGPEKSVEKGLSFTSLLPSDGQKSDQESLLKGPNGKRFQVGDFYVYKAPLRKKRYTFIGLAQKGDLQKQAALESVDTLASIIVALTILLSVAHFLIRREFIRPAQTLVSYLETESKGPGKVPTIHKGWQPWQEIISNVFAQNRRLIDDLEKHIQTLDQKVHTRTEEIRHKNKELEDAFHTLKEAQDQIILQEKMASLGALTAGIAHEMKNPLNFIINFSEVSRELMTDLREQVNLISRQAEGSLGAEMESLAQDLDQNMAYIREHGQRADHIVRSMLLHAREGTHEKTMADVNQLLQENAALAISGFKGNHRCFQVETKFHLDPELPRILVVAADVGRVFLNMVNNACYALHDKKAKGSQDVYTPQLTLSTRELEKTIEVRIRDNGPGLPESVAAKIFDPFFTTKPPGQGTGLGLSMCYEIIVKEHGGSIDIETAPGNYTEFIIQLPKMQGQ